MEAKCPQENALLTGVIWKQILLFFLPVALGTFFQQMYNTVDALVVGNFVGMNALGAVGGATASVINLILGFFVGVSSGATVVIADNGIGIREEDQARVFEKGFTGYNGRADKKSTGIGLYLCRLVCDRLNHGISLVSRPGQGTLVRLDLGRMQRIME